MQRYPIYFLKSVLTLAITLPLILSAESYQLKSPNETIVVSIETTPAISFSVSYDETVLIEKANVGLTLEGVGTLGREATLVSAIEDSQDQIIEPIVARRFSKIHDYYNSLTLNFDQHFRLEFRAYDDGVAYRFGTSLEGSARVTFEQIDLEFPLETMSYFPGEDSILSHNERLYPYRSLMELSSEDFCTLPVMMVPANGPKLLFSEADLVDYPALFMKAGQGNTLSAKHPPYVVQSVPAEQGSDRNEEIVEIADHIARTAGTRNYPWRVFIIGEDAVFLENELVYQLSSECDIEDPSWIQPGVVAWDWYNANNIFGVDFESGINTETYKYYIDFAAEYGLDYIILDEGWSESTTKIDAPAPGLDVQELIDYGKEKGIGVILWALWGPIAKDRETIFPLYEKWGAAGVKIDFMQRSDQTMVNFYHDTAELAVKHRLLVDYHGSFKPAGLRRKFPNVINYEGVKGEENNKWSADITPTHNVTIPFTRMAVGPMDYTPGAMTNKHLINHNISFDRPESIGTRAHEVAKYVVFDSPLQMLCDTPSIYRKEAETTSFITKIPTTWDETKVLDAAVAEFILVARRKGNTWYVAAMTNEQAPRDLTIDWSFLGNGTFEGEIYADGINVERCAQDYKRSTMEIDTSTPMQIHLGTGGGWCAILTSK